jgi:hypothetical protein
MQSYVNHLLQDIIDAQRAEIDYSEIYKSKPQSIEEHFEEIERWLEGEEPAHSFSYYCGLQTEQFPPSDKLTEEQVMQINEAFKHLLFTWNLGADIPAKIPPAKTYDLLIPVLDKKTDIVNSGFITFEFCNYDPPSCPFEEYCTCKDFEMDMENDTETGKPPDGDLPF